MLAANTGANVDASPERGTIGLLPNDFQRYSIRILTRLAVRSARIPYASGATKSAIEHVVLN